jgi:hypothetical protein
MDRLGDDLATPHSLLSPHLLSHLVPPAPPLTRALGKGKASWEAWDGAFKHGRGMKRRGAIIIGLPLPAGRLMKSQVAASLTFQHKGPGCFTCIRHCCYLGIRTACMPVKCVFRLLPLAHAADA